MLEENQGEPVALTLTASAPQLFRDLVARSLCVSRFRMLIRKRPLTWLFRSPCESRFTVNTVPCVSIQLTLSQEISSWPRPTVHSGPQHSACNYRGCYSTRHTPLRQRSVCSSCSPRAGHGGQVVSDIVARGRGMAGYANYRHGADRCSMAGMGVGAGSLKILTGVLVHRVTRPLRGSVSCGTVVAGRYLVCRFN